MSKKDRVKRLEIAASWGDEITVIHVNWREDGLIEDEKTGELLTEDEYKRRYPETIFVGFDESEDPQERESGDE